MNKVARSWLLASLTAFVACSNAQTNPVQSTSYQKPFRAIVHSDFWDCPSITMSRDRTRLVGAGNVKYFGWTDKVTVWAIPELSTLAQVELTRKDHFDGRLVSLCPALSSNGQSLAYRDRLNSVLVRDVLDADVQRRVSFGEPGIGMFRFRFSDQELVTLISTPSENVPGEYSIQLVIHDLDTGERRHQYLGRTYVIHIGLSFAALTAFRAKHPEEGIALPTLSPSGESVAFFRVPEGEVTGAVEIWDIDSWQRKLVMEYPFGLASLIFSDDGLRLAMISTAGRVHAPDANSLKVIDVSRNEILLDVETSVGPNHSYFADFSPDGTQLATGTRRNGIQIWDLATSKRIGHAQLGGGYNPSTGLAFSSDGRELYVMNKSGELRTVRLQDILEKSGQFPGLENSH